MRKKNTLNNNYEPNYSSKREADLFYSLCDKKPNIIKAKNFKNALLKSGLKINDNRLHNLFQKLNSSVEEIHF